MVWPLFKIRRKEASLMLTVTNFVSKGNIAEGLDLFNNKLAPIEQALLKQSLTAALQDCANFLDTEQDYRGDPTTVKRLANLHNTFPFATDLDVSIPEL